MKDEPGNRDPWMPYRWVECPKCEGKGRVELASERKKIKCDTCSGKGSIASVDLPDPKRPGDTY